MCLLVAYEMSAFPGVREKRGRESFLAGRDPDDGQAQRLCGLAGRRVGRGEGARDL